MMFLHICIILSTDLPLIMLIFDLWWWQYWYTDIFDCDFGVIVIRMTEYIPKPKARDWYTRSQQSIHHTTILEWKNKDVLEPPLNYMTLL